MRNIFKIFKRPEVTGRIGNIRLGQSFKLKDMWTDEIFTSRITHMSIYSEDYANAPTMYIDLGGSSKEVAYDKINKIFVDAFSKEPLYKPVK